MPFEDTPDKAGTGSTAGRHVVAACVHRPCAPESDQRHRPRHVSLDKVGLQSMRLSGLGPVVQALNGFALAAVLA